MDEFEPNTIAGEDSSVSPTPEIRLIHSMGSLAGSVSRFRGGSITLGRRGGLELRFDDQSDFLVSGIHARLTATPSGQWQLADLGSSNGTTLNGAVLEQPEFLQHGDSVVLGSVDGSDGAAAFRVEIEGASGPARAAAAVRPFQPNPIPADQTGPPPSSEAGAGGQLATGPAKERERREDAGFLNLRRLKSAVSRFVSRREVQKALDQAESQLASLSATSQESCAIFGKEAWGRPDVPWSSYPSSEECSDFDARRAEIDQKRGQVEEELEQELASFSTDMDQWKGAHQKLEEALEAARREKQEAEGERDAPEKSVRQLVEPSLMKMQEAVTELEEFVATQVEDPSEDFEARLEIGVELLETIVGTLKQPLEGADAAFERRAEARRQLAEATAALEQCKSSTEQSEQGRIERENRHAQEHAGLQNQLGQLDEELRRLETVWKPVFARLAEELLELPHEAIQSLPSYPPAAQARERLLSHQAHIDSLRAELERLS